MRKRELLERFVYNSRGGTGSNLKSDGQEVINYNTTIALHRGRYIVINNEYYSSTTSTNQNILIETAKKAYADHHIILTDEEHINGLKQGRYDLNDLITAKYLVLRNDKKKFAREFYSKEENPDFTDMNKR